MLISFNTKNTNGGGELEGVVAQFNFKFNGRSRNQAAPDVRIGGGQRQRALKIWSKLANLGGLGAFALRNFF